MRLENDNRNEMEQLAAFIQKVRKKESENEISNLNFLKNNRILMKLFQDQNIVTSQCSNFLKCWKQF